MTHIKTLPTFINSATLEQFRKAFDSVQCVSFKKVDGNCSIENLTSSSCGNNVINTGRKKRKKRKHQQSISPSTEKSIDTSKLSATNKVLAFTHAILETIKAASSEDQNSWTIENDLLDSSTLASDFLSPTATQNGYCSFILRDDSNLVISNFEKRHVRHPSLPLSATGRLQKQNIVDTVCIARPYWVFVGRNNNTHEMKGRNEHTDDIQHNGGTFHYQVAGTKIWRLRPTKELREMCDKVNVSLEELYIHTVEEGDIFVINTRLWWHQTEIPGAKIDKNHNGGSLNNLSISYARDVYLDGTQPSEGDEMHMFTQDGAWATGFIPKGTVLISDVDPPISRTNKRVDANCELFVVGDDEEIKKQFELVTTEDIKEGAFFTIFEGTKEE